MPAKSTGFEGLLEAVPDALVGVDKFGVIRFVNRQTESLFDYGRSDLIGAPFETLVPQSVVHVRAVHGKGYGGAPRTGPIGADLSLSGVRRDGTEFPLDIALSQIDTGSRQLVIAAVRDMTHYRSSDEERRRADRLFAIVEYSGEAIVDSTLDGIITSWNPAARRIFGYSSAEVIGRSAELLRPQDRAEEATADLARIRNGHHIEHVRTERVRKDGTVFPVSLSVSPIRDADGTVMGASTIARDLSEVSHAAEYARSLIEANLDSMVAISAEGKITDANESMVSLTGVSRDNLIGTSFSDYFTDPERAEDVYQRVFTEGKAVDYPLTLRHANGHETQAQVMYNASVYRDAGGNVLGVVAAARDVTERMQVQREMAERQAQEQRRLEELERFQELTVGRELKMIELKKEIEYLRKYGPDKRPESDQEG